MLEHQETLLLIRQAQSGNIDAKEKLIEHNYPLVKSVIKRYQSKRLEYEDLYQLGCLGFLKAIENFDEKYNVKFSTYAVPMIAGEVKRFLRDDGIIKISRSIKSQFIKINRYIESYRKENNRAPRVEEISKELEMEPQEVMFAMDATRSMVSLDETYDVTNLRARTVLDTIASKDKTDNMIDKILLKNILSELNEKDRKIIVMRYFRDRTQSQIAKELGVSQVQVSRLENKILEKIKAKYRTEGAMH